MALRTYVKNAIIDYGDDMHYGNIQSRLTDVVYTTIVITLFILATSLHW